MISRNTFQVTVNCWFFHRVTTQLVQNKKFLKLLSNIRMYSPSNFHGFHRFHEIFYKLRKYISTVWKNEKFTVTQKKNSSNQLFSIFFSKNVTFTKFLSKILGCEIQDVSTSILIAVISLS